MYGRRLQGLTCPDCPIRRDYAYNYIPSLGVETLGDPSNIIIDGGPNFPQISGSFWGFAKLLWPLVTCIICQSLQGFTAQMDSSFLTTSTIQIMMCQQSFNIATAMHCKSHCYHTLRWQMAAIDDTRQVYLIITTYCKSNIATNTAAKGVTHIFCTFVGGLFIVTFNVAITFS